MRNHVTHIATAVALAALAVACGGDNSNQSRYLTESGRGRGLNQHVKLEGCVAPAGAHPGEYVLREVFLPEPAEQPMGQETAQVPPVVNGSWVRLSGDAAELNLKDYLGKRVEVDGNISETGQNTLGTSGHAGTNEDKFERSSRDAGTDPVRNIPPTTAAPAGADANGDAPQIAIEHVKALGQSCQAEAESSGGLKAAPGNKSLTGR